MLNNPVNANDPYGTQAADQPKEEFYANGTDPETGAHESYSVTPDFEVHEYVEFEPDNISASPQKPSPPAKTDAQTPEIVFESQPFDVDAWMAQVSEMLKQTDTPEYKAALGMAMAEQARQAEFEREMKEEAELEKELPGLGASMIPIYGNGKSFLVHFKHGNYGRAAFYAVMTISDASGAAALGKAAIKGGAAALRGVAAAEFRAAVKSQLGSSLTSERTTLVYQLVDDSGQAMYYGVSKDYRLLKRLSEHAGTKSQLGFGGSFRGLEVISDPLSQTEAHNLERWLIRNNPGVVNLAKDPLRIPVGPLFVPSPIRPSMTILNPTLYPR